MSGKPNLKVVGGTTAADDSARRKEAAREFLRLLDPDAERHVFQTYDDVELRNKPRQSNGKFRKRRLPSLGKVHIGTLDELWPTLDAFNNRGAAVGVCINRTDLKGRSIENIKAARALFQDDDTGHGWNAPVPFDAEVITSEGHAQRYIWVDSIPAVELDELQATMCVKHGCDPNVKDRARVMRLPGTFNMKDPAKPFLVRLSPGAIGSEESLYDRAALLKYFPPDERVNVAATVHGEAPLVSARKLNMPPELIRAVLWAIPTSLQWARLLWLKIGAAVKLELGDEGRALWDEWSQRIDCYDEDDQERTWASLNRDGSDGQKVFTLASALWIAREHGFATTDPRECKMLIDWQGDFDDITDDAVADLQALIRALIERRKAPERGRFHYMSFDRDPDTIPPRPMLLRGQLAMQRGAATGLVAPGGTGKSALAVGIAVAFASGDGSPLGLEVVGGPYRVLLINNEDDELELERRVQAYCRLHEIDRHALKGRIATYTHEQAKKFLAVRRDPKTGLVPTDAILELTAFVRKDAIDVVISDPLVSLHEASENDNSQIEQVMTHMREVPRSTACGMLILHHTTKQGRFSSDGFAGNADSGRGAGAFKDCVRYLSTLYTASESDAEKYDMPAAERLSYTRLDNAKASYIARTLSPHWLRLASVRLGTETTVAMQHVQLKEKPQEPGGSRPKIEPIQLRVLRKVIDAACANGQVVKNPVAATLPAVALEVAKKYFLELYDTAEKVEDRERQFRWALKKLPPEMIVATVDGVEILYVRPPFSGPEMFARAEAERRLKADAEADGGEPETAGG